MTVSSGGKMIALGEKQILEVVKETDFGIYLSDKLQKGTRF